MRNPNTIAPIGSSNKIMAAFEDSTWVDAYIIKPYGSALPNRANNIPKMRIEGDMSIDTRNKPKLGGNGSNVRKNINGRPVKNPHTNTHAIES